MTHGHMYLYPYQVEHPVQELLTAKSASPTVVPDAPDATNAPNAPEPALEAQAGGWVCLAFWVEALVEQPPADQLKPTRGKLSTPLCHVMPQDHAVSRYTL